MRDAPKRLFVQLAVFIFLGILAAAWSMSEQDTRSFVGAKEFTTYQEAQTYQSQVIEAALSRGADMKTSISISSPPTLTYQIVVPADNKGFLGLSVPHRYTFECGKTVGSPVGVWISFGILAPFCIGLFGLFTWQIWFKWEDEVENVR
jgi:hypothetical protein